MLSIKVYCHYPRKNQLLAYIFFCNLIHYIIALQKCQYARGGFSKHFRGLKKGKGRKNAKNRKQIINCLPFFSLNHIFRYFSSNESFILFKGKSTLYSIPSQVWYSRFLILCKANINGKICFSESRAYSLQEGIHKHLRLVSSFA